MPRRCSAITTAFLASTWLRSKDIERQFAGKAEYAIALGANYTAQSPALTVHRALVPPSGAGHGVLAEYFDNPELQGAPKLRGGEPRPFLQAGSRIRCAAFPQRTRTRSAGAAHCARR